MVQSDSLLTLHPYTVDLATTTTDNDTGTAAPVPANKGHEAMPYLSYLIAASSSPDALADITLFMHAHRYTWHNNDILSSDALQIITRLSSPAVERAGYFNLRCHLDPGCPAHLHPDTNTTNVYQPEEREIGAAWAALFPGTPIPTVLSQPCCSQFALSKQKILSIPLSTYTRLRDWLIATPLPDALAGRVFEYVWQYLFLGLTEHCPSEYICYCDGYGVCFASEPAFLAWFDVRDQWRVVSNELWKLGNQDKEDPDARVLESERARELGEEEKELKRELEATRRVAFLRGNEPGERARVAGRVWEVGDGF